MAKRSLRRPLRYERDQAGCMWGLISIFDFRHGRFSQKLLSDRRRGRGHATGAGYSRTKVDMLTNFEDECQSIVDGKESEATTADAMKTSVKELMEEEMSNEEGSKQQTKSPEVELKQFDSKHGGQVTSSGKQVKRPGKKSFDSQMSDLDAARNLGPEDSCHQGAREKNSKNPDLEVMMEELCHQFHQKSTSYVKHDSLDMQSKQEYSVFQEKLSTAIKVIIDQRSTDEKCLTEGGATHDSKEFVDALEMLCSNKELFLKLVQDKKSPLLKPIQDLENALLNEDQNSNIVTGYNKFEQDLSKSKPDELVIRKRRNFFRRKSKSLENIPMKGDEMCQPSSRIVILKPGPASLQNSDTQVNFTTPLQSPCNMENKMQGERNPSQFSFTEIKRKLKHAMGKERHGISGDCNTHRFPYEHQNMGDGEKGDGGESGGWSSPNRNHFYTEKFAKPSIGVKKRDKIGKSRGSETSVVSEPTGYPRHGVPNLYLEAKKHLSEMLSNGDENADSMSRVIPKTLGRILSLPEYNFSRSGSPEKDNEHGFVTARMRLSPRSNSQMVNENTWQLVQEINATDPSSSMQNFEVQQHIADDNPDEEVPSSDYNPDEKVPSPVSIPGLSCDHNQNDSEEETLSPTRDEMDSEGIVDNLKTTNSGYQKNSQVLDVLLEPSGSLVIGDTQSCDTAEVCDEERSSQSLKLDSLEEDQMSSPSASPSSSSVTRKIEDPDSVIEKTERPSPISVLELLYAEDDISPEKTIPRPIESAIQPLKIHFEERSSSATEQGFCIGTGMEDEESEFEYVEAVLLGSGLNWDEFLLRWLSTDEVLDPTLFEEVVLFSNRSCHDQKLLFDSTHEVLKEKCEHYFGFFPTVSSVKSNIQPVPRGINLINEVWEGVEWHILQQASPHSLDQLIRKDLAKSGTWMDLRFETEYTGVEIGAVILADLIEDTVLSLANDTPEEEFPVLLNGLNGSESDVDLKNNLVSRSGLPRVRIEAK
ncbi:unnamed protein product [Ilex paraguariensis]|uniref:DUF4378 domain-containing protein n=1 Tax=Ilex paraguariensis TaxID=185542 RepID=A0ABC8RFC5_9AQUA